MDNKLMRFIDCYIPTETCNLRCKYCYIAQKRKFNSKICRFNKTPEEIRAALSQKRLGGTCLINFCAGGETLLTPELYGITRLLLEEGHYVMIVTNGTLTKPLSRFWQLPDSLKSHFMFKFSFHYLEMLRLKMVGTFCDNVKRTRLSGCSISVEVTPSDELIPHINDLKEVCLKEFGAVCHITIARNDNRNGIDLLTDRTFDEYKKIWGEFESEMFSTKMALYHVKRKEFCHAGDWSLYTNILTGDIYQCYCGKRIGNLYDMAQPIIPRAVGKHCPLPYCYNGHAFLTLGVIAGLNLQPFSDLRDREMRGGNNWLSPQMKQFLSQRLFDNHEEYSSREMLFVNMRQLPYSIKVRTKRLLSRFRRKS